MPSGGPHEDNSSAIPNSDSLWLRVQPPETDDTVRHCSGRCGNHACQPDARWIGFHLDGHLQQLNGNAVVNWNAAPQSNTTHPMANMLSVMIPAADIATAGTAQVSVTNPGSSTPGGPYGGGSNTPSETSNSMTFTIN